MFDWPKYQSHKIVQAAPIYEVVDHGGVLSILVKPRGGGYKSVSPKDVFEGGYTRVP